MLAVAGHPFGNYHSIIIWNGQADTDAMSCFSRTAILTHDPFKVRFGPSSSTIRPRVSAPFGGMKNRLVTPGVSAPFGGMKNRLVTPGVSAPFGGMNNRVVTPGVSAPFGGMKNRLVTPGV